MQTENSQSTSLPVTFFRHRWPWIIVGLLTSHVLLMVVAVTIAVRDRSFAVVPNYYERGVNWDADQAALRASAKLGWHVDAQASDEIDPTGKRALRFVVTDASGHAVPGATIELEYFHDAHGDEDRTVKLTADPSDPTHFSAVLPMRYAGDWELHFTITAGKQTFVGKQNLTLASTPAGRAA